MPTYSVFTNHQGLLGDYAQFVVNGEIVWLYFENDGTGVMPEPHIYQIPEAVALAVRESDPHSAYFTVASNDSTPVSEESEESEENEEEDEGAGDDEGANASDQAETPTENGTSTPTPKAKTSRRKAGA
jgi:hypothetical protein